MKKNKEVAAPLLCAGVIVYKPLKRHVEPGMRVGIGGIGGIGGLGHLALQFVKALEAIPVAFSHSPGKELQAREHLVVSGDPDHVKKASKSIHVLLVAIGAANQHWDQYISFITRGGKLAPGRRNGSQYVCTRSSSPSSKLGESWPTIVATVDNVRTATISISLN